MINFTVASYEQTQEMSRKEYTLYLANYELAIAEIKMKQDDTKGFDLAMSECKRLMDKASGM